MSTSLLLVVVMGKKVKRISFWAFNMSSEHYFLRPFFVGLKPFLVNLVVCVFFFIKKLLSIWLTFPLMNILNIYRLDFVVQWSIWYFFDWIKLVAFWLLRAFDSSSAILKKLSSFQLGSVVLLMAFLWWCSWDSKSN